MNNKSLEVLNTLFAGKVDERLFEHVPRIYRRYWVKRIFDI
jgi:hypothetical protein